MKTFGASICHMKTTFASFSFGCRVNEAEKILINKQLIQSGFMYDEKNPQFFIINSCAVTGKAEREVRQFIYQTRKKYPKTKIIVTGCAATLWNTNNLKITGIDLILTNTDKQKIPEIIKTKYIHSSYHNKFLLNKKVIGQGIDFPDKFLGSGRLVIKIQDGCDRFCSYCIVPYLRGKSKSKKINDIITEITSYKTIINEVILTAVNTEAFGSDTGETIINLIDAIIRKTSVPQISFGSIHPWSLTNEFIDYYKSIKDTGRFVPFFHVPIQSGSNSVLARMNRKYKAEDIIQKLKKIKKINPNAIIGTDIIVGFPGETENEFTDTVNFLKNAPIDKIHVFRYSTRPGTVAEKNEKEWGIISEEEKRKRSKILRRILLSPPR